MVKNISVFNKFNQMEIPQLVLCELSKEQLCVLYATNLDFKLNFNDISSVSFNIPKTINGEPYRHYDEAQELRLIYVKDLGYFQIVKVCKSFDGMVDCKECEAYSVQAMLGSKRITGLAGEFVLWNPVDKERSLMHLLLPQAPSWSIGTVDAALTTRQRSVKIDDQDLYSMLTNNFYEIFEALFIFDYENYVINIYDARKDFKDTDAYLDTHNVIKDYQIDVQTDRIVTAVRVIGGDGIDISGVNPNGTDTLYNVDYYIDRMTPGLQSALAAYKVKYNSYRQMYSDLLVEQKNASAEVNRLQSNAPQYDVSYTFNEDGTARITPDLTSDSGLRQLEGLRANLENVRAARIQHGNIPYTDVNALIAVVDPMIEAKEQAIASAELDRDEIAYRISSIVEELRMRDNFTDEQWVELNEYFIYDTIQENAFIITDVMSQEEKQAVRLELLEHGELILNKTCYPTYLYKISSVNFFALPEFKDLQNEIELGAHFTLKVDDNYAVKPMFLGVRTNFRSQCDLVFGNKTKVNDGFDFSAFRQAVSMGTSISFDRVKIEAMKGQSDEVAEFIHGSLIAATNNIKSTKDYTTATINEDGIRLRQYDKGAMNQTPYEAWLTGSMFAFSDDNFHSSKMALGRIEAPGGTGGSVYGVVGEAICGTILAGNELHIANKNNNFRLTEDGCFLENANMTITKTQGGVENKIVLDPVEGFAIYAGPSRQVYLGADGKVHFVGEISGGSININNRFLVDQYGYMTASGATIQGTIQSSTINGGSIIGSQISIGNGAFTVNSGGYATCQDIHIRNTSTLDLGNYNGNQNGLTVVNGILKARGAVFEGTIQASKIIGNTISGGTITGAEINGGTVKAGRYYALSTTPGVAGRFYLEIGEQYGDLTLKKENFEVFQVYDDIGGATIKLYQNAIMTTDYTGSSSLKGNWEYNGSEVATKADISDGGAIETRVSALERNVADILGGVSRIEARISGLEARVSALEAQ